MLNKNKKFPRGVKIVWLSVRQRAAYRAKLPFDWLALWSDILFWDLVLPFEENFKIIRYNRILSILMDSNCWQCQKKSTVFFSKNSCFLLEKFEKISKFPWKLIVAKRFNVKQKTKISKGGSNLCDSLSFRGLAAQLYVRLTLFFAS